MEKRRKINQDSRSDWQRARVFSVKAPRTALILFLLPSSSLIHHLPPQPSWCCRLLLNVSPNSPAAPSLCTPLFLLLLLLIFSPSLSRLHGRPFGARRNPRNDAPLIFLFCNLQRRRTSCFTCVIFYSCSSPSFCTDVSSLFSHWGCFPLFVFIMLSDTVHDRMNTSTEKAVGRHCVLVQRSPSEGGASVYAGSRCIQRQRVLKIALSQMVTLTKVWAAFSATSLLFCFSKGHGVPFYSPIKFFCFLFEWCVSTAFKVWESDELWILCLNSCGFVCSH